MRKKFEYIVLHVDGCSNGFDQQKYLNEKGKDGWELVGVTATTNGKPILYLKRELKKKNKVIKSKPKVEPKEFQPYYDKEKIPREVLRSRMAVIIVDKLGVEESEVTTDASFQDDLGADSLDAVEILMEFEKEFNVALPDEEAEKVRTFGDAVDLLYKLINK